MAESDDEEFSLRKNTLQLRLQQRRSRKVLAEQGIIPPLKSPGTYFEQVQRLERARKEDYLNRAIQIRPERDTLVQKHILEDTSASNQLVACQKDLKKAKLADNLNDKIAFRPGIIELVERNIFPADDKFQEALKGGHLQYKKIADFVDEDSSDQAFSPEVPTNASPPHPPAPLKNIPTSIIDSSYSVLNDGYSLSKSGSSSSLYLQSNSSHPYLARQTSKGSKGQQSNVMLRMSNARKKKEKPKFKKFKYHQYVPPDQQGKSLGEHNLPQLGEDTPYSRLLEQQQLYLQIQIMNNQFSNNNRQNEVGQGSFPQQSMVSPPPSNNPLMGTIKIEKTRTNGGTLTPAKLEEMKVSELKEELKCRGCKVTGTKEILIERLKPFCVKPFFNLANESNKMTEMSYPSADDLDTTSRSPLTYDPNTGFTHRIARMPHPETHRVTLKQEKFTMPTWHMPPPPAVVATGGSRRHSGMIVETDKDMMLEKQQKEIDDLKRMVELHRSQLQHLQGEPPKGETPKLSSFQFPTFQQNIPQRAQQQITRNPPNYNQAYEMLNNENDNRDTVCPDMDDLLDILKDTGELPNTPNIMRVKPHGGKPDYYPQQQQQQNQHQVAHGYRGNDLTKMLVESSGDALMDTSNFPPVSYTTTLNDTYHTTAALNDTYHTHNSYSSARNSFDSGVIYSTPHFSPMDTNSQEFANDLRLSTSSLDSGEPTLNAVSLSPHNMTVRPLGGSPRTHHHNHLVKSASQELLGPNRPATSSELGWLDLTLGSAVGGPPSPGFDPLSFEDPQMQMRYNGSQDNGLNCYATGSTGALNYPPSNNMGADPQWDTWEGLLSNNFNS